MTEKKHGAVTEDLDAISQREGYVPHHFVTMPDKVHCQEGFVYYDVKYRAGNVNRLDSYRVYMNEDQFDAEQQQVVIQSIRLMQTYGNPDCERVNRIASNHPRDNSRPFNGWRYNERTFEGLRQNGYTDCMMLNYASIEFGTVYDRDHDGRDDDFGHQHVELYIEGFQEIPPDPVNGRWTLGLANIRGFSRRLDIKLNTSAIGSRSQFSYRMDRLTWAETILHEIHHVGWNHGTFGDSAYEASWMVAYGRVLFRNQLALNPLIRLCDLA